MSVDTLFPFEDYGIYLCVTLCALCAPLSCRFFIRGKPTNKNAAVLSTRPQHSK